MISNVACTYNKDDKQTGQRRLIMMGVVKGYTNLHAHADGILCPCQVCKLHRHTNHTMGQVSHCITLRNFYQ